MRYYSTGEVVRDIHKPWFEIFLSGKKKLKKPLPFLVSLFIYKYE